jgi:hypothetical protein
MSHAFDDRRFAILRLGPDFLISTIRGETSLECIGLPEDVQFVTCDYRYDTRQFELTVTSKSFEVVPPGHCMPVVGAVAVRYLEEEVPIEPEAAQEANPTS